MVSVKFEFRKEMYLKDPERAYQLSQDGRALAALYPGPFLRVTYTVDNLEERNNVSPNPGHQAQGSPLLNPVPLGPMLSLWDLAARGPTQNSTLMLLADRR